MTRYSGIVMAFTLLAGCAGSPPNTYYTLSVESPCPAISQPGHMGSLETATIRLPGVLDRPQLVVRTGPQTVEIREFDRWAEPLDQMATRVLTEDIAPCQSTVGVEKVKYSLSVSIEEFMADTSGQAHLTGRWWTLQKGEERSLQLGHSFSLSETVDKAPGAASVAAMSALLGRLAGEIVGSVSHPENHAPVRPSS
jgi:uncharacterized lipoprotein YmbA